MFEAATSDPDGSPPITRITLPTCRAHYPDGPRWVHMSIASPSTRPSPLFRRVGIHTFTFEACSGFTHVTARWIAQPPKAAFVTRLRPDSYPTKPLVSYQINRQLSGWILPPLVIRAVGAHRIRWASRAHFDYQRQRVYIRDSKLI